MPSLALLVGEVEKQHLRADRSGDADRSSAKNSILIVEFAKAKYEEGLPLFEAALEGAELRLRPILMTSFAFILGCVPLAMASGAGALSRQVMGFVVIGGMMAASFVAVFLIPVLFYLVEKYSGRKPHPKRVETPALEPSQAMVPPH